MKLMVIWGSSRQGRKGGVVAGWVKNQASADGRFEIDFVDLRELNLPFFDEPTNPANIKSLDEYTNPEGRAWAERVAAAEAFIFVTPEYNYAPSAVLKNALDWVGHPWADKPVGLIGYGGIVGGARAVQQLRPIVASLGLIQAASSLHFPNFEEVFDEQGQPKRLDYYQTNLKKMLDEILRLRKAFKK